MNREIKFRGKRIDNGEWVYGYLLKNINGDCAIQQEINAVKNGWWHSCVVLPVIPESVGQYTGLKDNDDNEIYEGDIIAEAEDEYKYEVRYFGDEDYPAFDVHQQDEFDSNGLSHLMATTGCKKIGNISDNPDLLKGDSK